jgi:Flp pilus assembly protein TadB
MGVRAFRRGGRAAIVTGESVDAVAVVVMVALQSGLTIPAALATAARHCDTPVRTAIEGLLREAHRSGLAPALLAVRGPLAALAMALARAHVSGAAASSSLRAFLDQRRSVTRARRLEVARALPVKLVAPISLLLLPGFLALVVAPTVIDQLMGVGAVALP